MLFKGCTIMISIVTFLRPAFADFRHLDWEITVVTGRHIELLLSNGTIVRSTKQPFNQLKALTFDNKRNQFVVSDTDQQNDTIFTVQLNEETETDITPIIQDLPDDILGLAIDPIEDVLYWTDKINSSINYVLLNDTSYEPQHFMALENQHPHAIVIDVCGRYIYWTNQKLDFASLERAKLDGTGHEVLVNTDIIRPTGLAIHYETQRLFWADTRGGAIYGRIESVNLEGKEREKIFEGIHFKPLGLAVDGDNIYWSDSNNNALFRIYRSKKTDPEQIIEFDSKPQGLVANSCHIKDLNQCKYLRLTTEDGKTDKNTPASEILKETERPLKKCFNGGELKDDACVCKRGFGGTFCETSMCHNFCVRGECYMSFLGKMLCHCEAGFVGNRCERNKCDDFCLNGGECKIVSSRDRPQCECPNGFIGDRCEYNSEICDIYCTDRSNDLFSEKLELLCRCSDGFNIFSDRNLTASRLLVPKENESFLSKLSDPLYYFVAILFVLLVVICALIVYIRNIHKRRPRIKKRIIVNKNVTPLTYRPQPNTEQCEITIENCCNMNVCETPCFEPKSFQEDKKNLLTNMEGEDMY